MNIGICLKKVVIVICLIIVGTERSNKKKR